MSAPVVSALQLLEELIIPDPRTGDCSSYVHTSECSSQTSVVRQTTSLLASRAYARVDSERSQAELNSLLNAVTHEHTVPLLRYSVPTSSNPSSSSPYSSGSIYPSELGWTAGAFNQSLDQSYVPSAFASANSLCPRNVSGGLVGPPWHAVVALENFYIR